MKKYAINEIFYSLQGEGLRAGTPNIFVRFAGCNLQCAADGEAGFDCDTEFTSGRMLTLEEIIQQVEDLSKTQPGAKLLPFCHWVVLTGGEPALQINDEMVTAFHKAGYLLAIETNGTHPLPDNLNWICCSPKTAEHTLRLNRTPDELKYVRHNGQDIPSPRLTAHHYLISPAVQPDGSIRKEDLAWCIELVKQYPGWRLSVQQHKQWGVR